MVRFKQLVLPIVLMLVSATAIDSMYIGQSEATDPNAVTKWEEWAADLNVTGVIRQGGTLLTDLFANITDFNTHTGNTSIHFEETEIDHTNILNIGTYNHTEIDTHIDNNTIHFNETYTDTLYVDEWETWNAVLDIQGNITSSNDVIIIPTGGTDYINISNDGGFLDVDFVGTTGRITNVANPTNAQDVATKDYVDTEVAGAGAGGNCTNCDDRYLHKSGGYLYGDLHVGGQVLFNNTELTDQLTFTGSQDNYEVGIELPKNATVEWAYMTMEGSASFFRDDQFDYEPGGSASATTSQNNRGGTDKTNNDYFAITWSNGADIRIYNKTSESLLWSNTSTDLYPSRMHFTKDGNYAIHSRGTDDGGSAYYAVNGTYVQNMDEPARGYDIIEDDNYIYIWGMSGSNGYLARYWTNLTFESQLGTGICGTPVEVEYNGEEAFATCTRTYYFNLTSWAYSGQIGASNEGYGLAVNDDYIVIQYYNQDARVYNRTSKSLIGSIPDSQCYSTQMEGTLELRADNKGFIACSHWDTANDVDISVGVIKEFDASTQALTGVELDLKPYLSNNMKIEQLDWLETEQELWVYGTDYDGGNADNYYAIISMVSDLENVTVDVGIDGNDDYTNTTIFTGPETIDLNITAIQNYLDSCTADTEGDCVVPLEIHSDAAGVLDLTNLTVKYQGDIYAGNIYAVQYYGKNTTIASFDDPVDPRRDSGLMKTVTVVEDGEGNEVFDVPDEVKVTINGEERIDMSKFWGFLMGTIKELVYRMDDVEAYEARIETLESKVNKLEQDLLSCNCTGGVSVK